MGKSPCSFKKIKFSKVKKNVKCKVSCKKFMLFGLAWNNFIVSTPYYVSFGIDFWNTEIGFLKNYSLPV